MTNDTIERLWNEYFSEECAQINTQQEKELIKKIVKMQESVNQSLSNEHNELIQNYIELLYDIQALFVKKAFFKGCEFSASFFYTIKNINP